MEKELVKKAEFEAEYGYHYFIQEVSSKPTEDEILGMINDAVHIGIQYALHGKTQYKYGDLVTRTRYHKP